VLYAKTANGFLTDGTRRDGKGSMYMYCVPSTSLRNLSPVHIKYLCGEAAEFLEGCDDLVGGCVGLSLYDCTV